MTSNVAELQWMVCWLSASVACLAVALTIKWLQCRSLLLALNEEIVYKHRLIERLDAALQRRYK